MPNLEILAASFLAITSNTAMQVPATLFGRAVAAVPDRDGDGLADLAVGAPRAPAGALDVGAVVFVSSADGRVLEVLRGDLPRLWFGWQLASVGSVGRERLAIGTRCGAYVRILDPIACTTVVDARGYTHAILAVTDRDGDGSEELVLGSPSGFDLVSGSTGVRLHGAVGRRYPSETSTCSGLDLGFGCWPGPDLDEDGEADLVSAELHAGRVEFRATSTRSLLPLWLYGEPAVSELPAVANAALASLDTDGDGRAELLFAEPNESVQGRVLVLDSRDGHVRERRIVTTGPNGTREVWSDHGAALTVLPDLDGDSIADYAIGVPGPAFRSSVALYSGAGGAELRRLRGESADEIGVALTWLPRAVGGEIAIVGVDDGLSHGTNYDNGSLRLWNPIEQTARWVLVESSLAERLGDR